MRGLHDAGTRVGLEDTQTCLTSPITAMGVSPVAAATLCSIK